MLENYGSVRATLNKQKSFLVSDSDNNQVTAKQLDEYSQGVARWRHLK